MRRRPAPRQRPCVESIDPKVLFSADIGAALLDGAPWAQAERRTLGPSEPRWESVFAGTGLARTWELEFDAPHEQTALAAPETAPQRREVVFIDASVPDVAGLTDAMRRAPGTAMEFVVIDADADGVHAISDYLAQHRDVAAIHIVSHGQSGVLQLGSTQLTLDALSSRSAEPRS